MKDLINFRHKINLTQFKMAKNIGVSLSLYQKVENGTRNASNNFISKLKAKYPEFNTNIFFK